MLHPLDLWFLNHSEPQKSCLEQLRFLLKKYHPDITEKLSYGMPFYYLGKKRLCYIWYHKIELKPYIGFVDGQQLNDVDLVAEKRSRMKIFLVDPAQDIPFIRITQLLDKASKVTTTKK